MTSSLALSPWVGAKKINGRWKFIGGLYVLKPYWAPGEPSIYGNCTSLRSIDRVGLRATTCYNVQPAVCKLKPKLCNGGNFGGNYGEIKSPGYPIQYYNNLDCNYIITTQVGTYITLTFDTLLIEELHDFVEIYDGNSTESKRIGDLASSITGETTFKSTSNQMFIYFHTDYKITDKGWRATWTAMSKSDPIQKNNSHGIMTSPNYPNSYDPFTEQIYNITVQPGSQINVTFDVFQTESNNDYLEIYDSSLIWPVQLIAKLNDVYHELRHQFE
uniref:CUB domain-containing protein n=1 Tax=Heterorhabditis bacteriophora TaxID=37862 RepID=A0A1I7XJZ1_HETBA